ncbi:hypothetical protein [Gordonia shandongensis]|uniref:hypothetical protein n=1 Tax=Gordonia shandongensis TaxID=376351 RepID=UPI0003F56E31|nr:hypothetical protein [Gordonia shandongensis]
MSSEARSESGIPEERWRRRRRLDAVFGDDLPEVIEDPSERRSSGRGRAWYDENRPPHHGG